MQNKEILMLKLNDMVVIGDESEKDNFTIGMLIRTKTKKTKKDLKIIIFKRKRNRVRNFSPLRKIEIAEKDILFTTDKIIAQKIKNETNKGRTKMDYFFKKEDYEEIQTKVAEKFKDLKKLDEFEEEGQIIEKQKMPKNIQKDLHAKEIVFAYNVLNNRDRTYPFSELISVLNDKYKRFKEVFDPDDYKNYNNFLDIEGDDLSEHINSMIAVNLSIFFFEKKRLSIAKDFLHLSLKLLREDRFYFEFVFNVLSNELNLELRDDFSEFDILNALEEKFFESNKVSEKNLYCLDCKKNSSFLLITKNNKKSIQCKNNFFHENLYQD